MALQAPSSSRMLKAIEEERPTRQVNVAYRRALAEQHALLRQENSHLQTRLSLVVRAQNTRLHRENALLRERIQAIERQQSRSSSPTRKKAESRAESITSTRRDEVALGQRQQAQSSSPTRKKAGSRAEPITSTRRDEVALGQRQQARSSSPKRKKVGSRTELVTSTRRDEVALGQFSARRSLPSAALDKVGGPRMLEHGTVTPSTIVGSKRSSTEPSPASARSSHDLSEAGGVASGGALGATFKSLPSWPKRTSMEPSPVFTHWSRDLAEGGGVASAGAPTVTFKSSPPWLGFKPSWERSATHGGAVACSGYIHGEGLLVSHDNVSPLCSPFCPRACPSRMYSAPSITAQVPVVIVRSMYTGTPGCEVQRASQQLQRGAPGSVEFSHEKRLEDASPQTLRETSSNCSSDFSDKDAAACMSDCRWT